MDACLDNLAVIEQAPRHPESWYSEISRMDKIAALTFDLISWAINFKKY